MIRKNIAGDLPQIDTTAFVDPSAVIIGRVKIGGNSYIGPGVVIRADRFSTVDGIARIEIDSNCSVQDTSGMIPASVMA
jgi:carbonic anhydrase/acetyltransferase-like protein (isoleucine patch superfamily)